MALLEHTNGDTDSIWYSYESNIHFWSLPVHDALACFDLSRQSVTSPTVHVSVLVVRLP